MRFASLGSGSKGNATWVEAGGTRIMVDCGFALKDVEQRAQSLGIELAALDGILVTHEHGDHLSGVGRLARAYKIPVYLTPGTWQVWRDREVPDVHLISAHQAFTVGAMTIHPLAVPHDAREPCQYRVDYRDLRLGILSDLGAITPYLQQMLSDCDGLLLETNHCPEMLAVGPYPASLKARVGGPWGHLSNQQAAGLAARINASRMQYLALTHLSEQNNTPERARRAICEALQQDPSWLSCANQAHGLGWHTLA